MDYCPHTKDDIARMQAAIGVKSIEELFADIPGKFRLQNMPDITSGLSEQETIALMSAIVARNQMPHLTLTGAGAYVHFIPSVVSHIVGRSEFYTAYTPYQA
ncbi:MAG: Glycine dehydrogenase (decarboxylating), partial [Deltaproteobacteria bacterium]|nr:Glycine dehydrogenase (decarboxylating) [Deltaproteobacteria bacterium]